MLPSHSMSLLCIYKRNHYNPPSREVVGGVMGLRKFASWIDSSDEYQSSMSCGLPLEGSESLRGSKGVSFRKD
uniref:Uncharacterized protein n=1 Tax=Daucus carota subsp. sativus TaxID=79200 RepID=A0A162A881_DAUCS